MSQSQGNVPVLQCVFAGWVFFISNLKQSYFLGLPFIFTAILGGWISIFSDPESTLSGFGPLFSVMSWVLFLMMSSALYRLAFGLPETGLGGLNLGGDEYRLFMVTFLVAIIAGLVAIVASILVMFAISPILASGIDPELLKANPELIYTEAGGKLWVVLGASAAFVWLVVFYLLARFSMAFPAAIIEKKIQIFEAAAWTKGQGWRIVIASLIAFAPVYILLSPGFFASAQDVMELFPAMVQNQDMELATADSLNHMRENFHWRVLGLLLVPALSSIRVGLFSALYRGLRPA